MLVSRLGDGEPSNVQLVNRQVGDTITLWYLPLMGGDEVGV
jgi:hypothetical protein